MAKAKPVAAEVVHADPFPFANQPIPECEETVEATESVETAATESETLPATESASTQALSWRTETEVERKSRVALSSPIARAREWSKIPREDRIAIVEDICVQVANGKGLKKVCESNPAYPSRVDILRWCHQDPEVAQLYRSGLAMRAELYADQIMDMADEARGKSAEEVQALKLMVNSRQWVASRLLPKMYGDHQTVEHTGEVQLNADQIDQRLALLVKKMQAIEVKG